MAEGKIAEIKHALVFDLGLFFVNCTLLDSLKSLLDKKSLIALIKDHGVAFLFTHIPIPGVEQTVKLSQDCNKLIDELIKKAPQNILNTQLVINGTIPITYTAIVSGTSQVLPSSTCIFTDTYAAEKLQQKNIPSTSIRSKSELEKSLNDVLEAIKKGAANIAITPTPAQPVESPKKERRKSSQTSHSRASSPKMLASSSASNITSAKPLSFDFNVSNPTSSSSPARMRFDNVGQLSDKKDIDKNSPSKPHSGTTVLPIKCPPPALKTTGKDSPTSSSSLETDTEDSSSPTARKK